jgi:hypothetical protein
MKIVLLSLLGVLAISCGGTADDNQPPADEINSRLASDGQDYTVSEEELKAKPALGAGKCGANTCKVGTYCCNASCGVCAPKGGACTQQYCGSTI